MRGEPGHGQYTQNRLPISLTAILAVSAMGSAGSAAQFRHRDYRRDGRRRGQRAWNAARKYRSFLLIVGSLLPLALRCPT